MRCVRHQHSDEPDPAQDSPQVGPPKTSAAGLPAVLNSVRQVGEHAGVRRGLPAMLAVNQKRGFDCPGCAWPEGDRRHRAEFCENGVKAVAEEATAKALTAGFFADHPVAELAERSGYWLGRQGRLTEPMYLAEGATHYEPVGWDRALDLVAEELRALDSPDEAVFYTSGRTSNEAAFCYQLFARALGTNNLPDCSNMCHESSGSALTETLGVGKGSVSLEDLREADLIIVAGQNPGTNHPRMLTALERAKRAGTRIVTVNPLPEAGMREFRNPQHAGGLLGRGTELTDLFAQIRCWRRVSAARTSWTGSSSPRTPTASRSSPRPCSTNRTGSSGRAPSGPPAWTGSSSSGSPRWSPPRSGSWCAGRWA
jgi:molybdopterin-dependent oxidoreductase alpha subunit